MSITEIWKKIKGRLGFVDFSEMMDKNTFLTAMAILIALISFGLGRLSGLETVRKNVEIEFPKGQEASAFLGTFATTTPKAPIAKTSGTYVASKNGTKYYLPTCASSNRISAQNKIWFDTKEEAQNAGYSPAANCKGI
ncbi:MAG: hypothetical protein WCT49_04890 [Candidatus Paceibacterota bacterium]|jgi:hypothetical protein|nr:hypothetical protein [Candidatus Paceibacterota bacterium]